MAHPLIAWLMAAAAVLSLVVMRDGLRGARRRGDWNASSTLVLGMGWLYALPLAAVAFTAGLRRTPDVYGDITPVYPGWYGPASRLGILLVGVLAVAVTIPYLRRPPRLRPAPLVAAALWLVMHLSGLRSGAAFLSGRSLVLLLCLLAAAVLPSGRGACLGAGVFGITLAAASGLLAVVHNNVAFVVPCSGACGGLGFSGLVPNPDLFADMLATTVAFAFLGFRGRSRYWFAPYLAAMALATGSLTASITVAVTLVLALVLRPRLDDERQRVPAVAATGALLAGTALVSAAMVTHTWSGSALSGRPEIWSVATDNIGRAPWLGHGADAWSRLYSVSAIPYADQRSAHNLWLDVLFSAGVIGVTLLVGTVLVVVVTAGRARLGVLVALVAIGTLGVAEPTWLTGDFDVLSYSFLAVLLIGPAAAAPSRTAVVPHMASPRRMVPA